MKDKLNVAIIGGGNLGQSMAKGIISTQNSLLGTLYITKRNTGSIKHMASEQVIVSSDNCMAVKASDVIILAVKPYNLKQVVQEFKTEISKDKVLISVATGVSLEELASITNENNNAAIVRAMPNTATDVHQSVTCISYGNNVSQEQKERVSWFFNLLGTTVDIDESLMDQATVLGACGIAYVLRFVRAMTQAGIEIGFDAATASAIVNQTVKGASELLIANKQHPESEIDRVTTPKGCTIVGLNEMEHNGFSSSLIKGIVSSYSKIGN